MPLEPFVVLMAEDDEHDILATRRAWKKHHISNPLYIVNDGEECLDFLHRRGKYSEPGVAPPPRHSSPRYQNAEDGRSYRSEAHQRGQTVAPPASNHSHHIKGRRRSPEEL